MKPTIEMILACLPYTAEEWSYKIFGERDTIAMVLSKPEGRIRDLVAINMCGIMTDEDKIKYFNSCVSFYTMKNHVDIEIGMYEMTDNVALIEYMKNIISVKNKELEKLQDEIRYMQSQF